MSPDSKSTESDKNRAVTAYNLSIAAVGGQVGCLTLLIIFVALFVGLWLDRVLQTKPMFTLLLMIGSVPVTLVAMFWVVRNTTSRLLPGMKQGTQQNKQNRQEEESDRGKTS